MFDETLEQDCTLIRVRIWCTNMGSEKKSTLTVTHGQRPREITLISLISHQWWLISLNRPFCVSLLSMSLGKCISDEKIKKKQRERCNGSPVASHWITVTFSDHNSSYRAGKHTKLSRYSTKKASSNVVQSIRFSFYPHFAAVNLRLETRMMKRKKSVMQQELPSITQITIMGSSSTKNEMMAGNVSSPCSQWADSSPGHLCCCAHRWRRRRSSDYGCQHDVTWGGIALMFVKLGWQCLHHTISVPGTTSATPTHDRRVGNREDATRTLHTGWTEVHDGNADGVCHWVGTRLHAPHYSQSIRQIAVTHDGWMHELSFRMI